MLETALCTAVSLSEPTHHEKKKEKENKCKVIKAGCAGPYIKQGAAEPGGGKAGGVQAYGAGSAGHVSPR